jgi:hypothetical protein
MSLLDDDDVTSKKVATKLKEVAAKPCEYRHVFVALVVGFILGAWIF